MKQKLLPKFTEFESKYKASLNDVKVLQELLGIDDAKFMMSFGTDTFYTRKMKPNHFARYRTSLVLSQKSETRSFWTIKEKPKGSKDSTIRFESNWEVTGTSFEEINAAAEKMGYKYNTEIDKVSYIWVLNDVIICIYSVNDDGVNQNYFIEIELNEKTIHTFTKRQAWFRLERYEKMLGKHLKSVKKSLRLKSSLFEIYRR